MKQPRITKKRVVEFLKDLDALAEKHGLIIAGCGHCGSPWIAHKPPDGEYMFELHDRIFDLITWQRST